MRYSSQADARLGARFLARKVIQRGEVMQDMYVYRCGVCQGYHLTRREAKGEHRNELVYAAPALDLQLWAMKPETRELALAGGKREEIKQPYANRPRGLR